MAVARPLEAPPRRRPRNRPLVVFLLRVAAALTAVALLANWARNELIDSSTFADTSTDLIKDKEIRDQVARYLVDEVDRGELSAGDKRTLRRQVATELDSPQAERLWSVAAENAHEQLVALIEDDNADAAVLDLLPLMRAIASELNLPDPGPSLSAGSGQITVLAGAQLRDARRVADSLQRTATALLIATLLVIGIAIALAHGWRRGAIAGAAIAVALGAAAVLVARSLVGNHVVDVLVPDGTTRDAAHNAWSIGTGGLESYAVIALVIAAVALAAAALLRPRSPNPLGPRRPPGAPPRSFRRPQRNPLDTRRI